MGGPTIGTGDHKQGHGEDWGNMPASWAVNGDPPTEKEQQCP